MNQKQPETRTLDRQPDLLDQIIESTRDVGVSYGVAGLEATSFTGLCTLAKMIFDSGAAPKSMDSSKKVLIAIAYGKTIGLDIWQSMKAIYIVNGTPSVWGRTVLALCRKNPEWVESGFDEYWEIKGERQDSHPAKFDDDTITAVCQTLRKGAAKPLVRKFSVADAKRAGLWSNNSKLYGPYPQRLLPARALGYCLDDNFGDSLKGIQIRETFDEEVDGKTQINNADELRNEIDKRRKVKTSIETSDQVIHPQEMPVQNLPPTPEQRQAIEEWRNNRAVLKEAVKQSFPENSPHSDLEDARGWLRSVFDKIPIRMGAAAMLKDASLRDGKWISYENIENIDDVDYLNSIAANLEDALKLAVGAKA